MTRKSFLFTLIALLTLMLGVAGATAQEPQQAGNGGCAAGATYDPACDVNRDGNMSVVDLELVANHWGQEGTWTSDFWSLTGNAGTDPATNFLGTTDEQPLVIKTNGAEAMRVTTGGNVGIGTDSPITRLDVDTGGVFLLSGVRVDAAGGHGVWVDSAGADGVRVDAAGGFAGNFNGAENDGTNAALKITSGTQDMLLDGNEIDALANGLFLNNNTDQKVILANGGGNVGIGTPSPSNTLDVAGDINAGGGGAGVSDGPSEFVRIGAQSDGWYVGVQNEPTQAESDFFIGLGSTEDGKFHIQPNGNVGIGTSAPNELLEVAGSGRVFIGDGGGASRKGLLIDAVEDGTYVRLHPYDYGTGSSMNLAISPYDGGNVGIGTSSPAAKLHIRGGTDAGLVGGGYLVIGSEGGKNIVIDEDQIMARNASGEASLFLNWEGGGGSSGSVVVSVLEIKGGSDLAEPFEVAGAEAIEPGMVVAIDPKHPGQLRIADKAYDRTVAGCVSGANGVNPGLTMQQEGTVADGSLPVALSGRVYCWADASNGPIQPGDLLTTSDRPGHAMAVTDYARAQGAILGKAMTRLEKGKTGLVLVLVSLQ